MGECLLSTRPVPIADRPLSAQSTASAEWGVREATEPELSRLCRQESVRGMAQLCALAPCEFETVELSQNAFHDGSEIRQLIVAHARRGPLVNELVPHIAIVSDLFP